MVQYGEVPFAGGTELGMMHASQPASQPASQLSSQLASQPTNELDTRESIIEQ